MKILYLLRHAKAERNAPSGEDFDRPLAERGIADAEHLGRVLTRRGKRPDCIVTSSARRTIETTERLCTEWPAEIAIRADKALYLAPAERLIQIVRTIPDDCAVAMLVGHNPGIEELAAKFAHGVASPYLRRLETKFPTCGLATVELKIESWSRAGADYARLTGFLTPKDLADGSAA